MPGISRPALAAALSLVGVLALAGCAPTQTSAAACTTTIKAVDDATSSINGALPTFSSDPTGTSTILARTTKTFHSDLATVTNPDIAKVANAADQAVAALASDVKKESADPASADFSKLAKSSSTVSEAFIDIRKACE